MKQLVYLFALIALISSCQKRTYISSIPAPTFEYHSSPKHHAEAPPKSDVIALEVTTPLSQNQLKEEEIVAQNTAVTSIVESAPASSLTPKKTTFKQRLTQRVVERKLTKMGVLKNTHPKAAKTDGVSVASFLAAILGLVGLFTTGWLFLAGMIAAIVLGFIGMSRVRHSGGQLSGRGWAIAGVVLGFLELLLLILGVLFVAALISGFGA